ncbi:MAG: hypothetical protein NUV75_05750 [Gallionella sp.]|nr:hypothetical protein [Gallionella sp.]
MAAEFDIIDAEFKAFCEESGVFEHGVLSSRVLELANEFLRLKRDPDEQQSKVTH